MSHLKQALFRVSKAGNDLATQVTGGDLSDLAKAQCLTDLIHEVKEMLGHASDSLNVDDNTFVYFKRHIDALDEDGELAEVIENLEEAADEPPYDWHKEEGYTKLNTGCK